MISIKSKIGNIFYSRSGTHALVEALKSCRFKKGSEILIPDFTCIWLPLSCYFANLKPILVDISSDDYNINIDSMKESLSDKTVGIITVDSFGSNVDLKLANIFCKENNLVHIRDQANGSFDNNTFREIADLTILSFGNNKYLECGGGGLLIFSNKRFLGTFDKNNNHKRHYKFNSEKIISYSYDYFASKFYKRNINFFRINTFLMRLSYYFLGSNMFPNYRISRLKKLKKRLQTFRKLKNKSSNNIKLYQQYLSNHNLRFQHLNNTDCVLKLNFRISKSRDYIVDKLNKIYPMPIQYVPLHRYLNLDSSQFKNSLELSKQIINLPINYIDSDTVIKLATKLDELLNEYQN